MGGTAGDSPRDVDVGWGCVGCSRVPHAGSAKLHVSIAKCVRRGATTPPAVKVLRR